MAKKIFTDESLSTLVSEIKSYTDTSSAERATKGHGIYYGTCATAAATAAKVVALTDATGFSLTTGAVVIVKFTYANSAASPTLNVNSTGAKSIMRYGTTAASTSSSTSGWVAGAVMVLVYDGTNWVRDYWNNSTYSNVSLGQGYATCSTAAATTAKVGTLSSYTLSTGGVVSVKFTYAVPANATLNINSKGAKSIYYRGAAITADVIKAGDVATFIYNGSQYHLISIDRWQSDIDSLQTAVDGKAASSHTHTASLATDTGTSAITLAHGSKYKLTAGGSSVIFTMPADNNMTYSAATTSAAGLMSAADKSKLDGITASADSVSFSRNLTSGTKVGTITINGTGTDLYAPTNTDTHYASKNVVGSSTATSNTTSALTNGNVYLNSVENGAVTSTHKISGSGATTVTTDASGNIVISSTDNNTTYGAAGSSLGLVKSGGDVAISGGVITVNDNSHNHTIANINSLQSTLDGKQATVTGGASTITSSNLTASRALVSDSSGKVAVSAVTSTELGYLDGVTSNIQTQLNAKAASSHTHSSYVTLEGEQTITGAKAFTQPITAGDIKVESATLYNVDTPDNFIYIGDDIIEINSPENISILTNVEAPFFIENGVSLQSKYLGRTATAAAASKLATARTISLTGDVTGSGTFDGSGDLSIATILSGGGVGESLEDKTVTIDVAGSTAVCGTGAEIFNDYRERTYVSTNAVTGNIATGERSHAEGTSTTASGNSSHAEGGHTVASGTGSHAEGANTTAFGIASHAEGYQTRASGTYAHAEGMSTTASGNLSHAEGSNTQALGAYAHAAGYYTIANDYQYVVGKYNTITTAPTSLTDTTAGAGLFIVGIGTSAYARSNGFRVNPAGKVYGVGTFGTSGADYAEYFEWFDGNPDNEDRRGHFVTLEGDKIRCATTNDDYILGVVSAEPSVAGDVHSEDWHNKYLKDVFGSKIVEIVEVEETTNEDGEIIPAHTERRWVLNPDYDPDVKYISREERPEWAAIGVVGKLVVVDDGTCQVNGYCHPNIDGIATASQEKTNYRVIERLDDTHIRIFIR